MTPKRPFRVIIAGGGVAGLSLANMLQSVDMDYVLLEAHDDMAPPVGASIGLMPNGLLILDQLGCYEPLRAVAQGIRNAHVRTPEGRSVACTEDLVGHLEKRHGYPMLFFDRQWLLQVLYKQLRHKDKVLVRKRVDSIEQLDDGVRVWTADGDSVTGDVVVGADGIHSTVRREMRRLAGTEASGSPSSGEEDGVSCHYRCSFGIAQDVDGWPDGDQCFTTGRGHSFLVVSGPERRCYWFMFDRLPDVKLGKDIPRYGKEDEARLVRRYAHLPIMEGLTFGQMYAKRITSTLTPLHEVVFDRWFSGRVVLVGDSAHKPNPISGMGGNGAIETAAELVNALLSRRGDDVGDMESVGREMQRARHDRAKAFVAESHAVQALYAFENPLASTVFMRLLVPLVGGESFLDKMASHFVGGSRLKHLPVPRRPRAIPFDHELPGRPVKPLLSWCVRAALASGMGLALLLSTSVSTRPLGEPLNRWGQLEPIKTRLGDAPLSVIRQGTALGTDPGVIHIVYALSQLVSPLLIYTVEGYRVGNHGTLLSLPSLYLSAMQVLGVGRIAPLYAVLASLQSFQHPAGRFVGPDVARALMPALILAFVIPAVMMLALAKDTDFWRSSPLVFSATTAMLSSGLKRRRQRRRDGTQQTDVVQEKQHRQQSDSPLDRYKDDDVPILKSVYHYAFAVQATVYLATLGYSCSHPDVSLAKLLLATPSPFKVLNKGQLNKGQVFPETPWISRYDMGFAAVGFVGQGLYAIWHLRRLGHVTSKDAAVSGLAFICGHVVFGPGATLAGLWSWRESVISGLSTLNRSR
ncbi:hypothetical protein G6O67_005582 [Ophiocordyceps sinensis]|uniref:FAD-binding domain-containing protein n=1 Tax=Ophiocordyceps sinensis TaxID=72228 RepID=A0A8H4PS07_9HYPO|nr:hypothetical protein G6O67_005582 [Ophiocordyceps sinensis]